MRLRRNRLFIFLTDILKTKPKQNIYQDAGKGGKGKGQSKANEMTARCASISTTMLQLLLMPISREPQKVKSLSLLNFSATSTPKENLCKISRTKFTPYPKTKAKYLGTDCFNIQIRIKNESVEDEKGFKGCHLWFS